MTSLKDRTLFISGASRGIGLAIAHALAAEGCRVSMSARTEGRLREAAAEVSQSAGSADRILAVTADVSTEAGAARVVSRTVESLGGIDLFFLGLGPEAGGASHLAYIKPGSGATYNDVAGLIPISQSILEHHINKFKAGGTVVTEADEAECRAAKHILTLGPAAILGARRIVQSIVDADTAPAKRESYRQLLNAKIADDAESRQNQFDQNPGLWLRVHPNVRSLILPNVLETNSQVP